ncbi:translation initiation factor IF-2 [Sphingobacteriales bacterium UPWRP_1]|nr:translation initiation factor IF-2 [Sphingobacteriales bacterium TSM_CSS]PSJ76817.1 translation initiation factor IF-2 [Sphingobacteriales bacterium UPWRP_1]
MSEAPKGYRLAKLALEINVGIEIIMEHLKKKNIEIDSNPNSKVNEEVRQLLLRDFKSDIVLKERADHIHLRSTRSDIEIAEEEKKIAPVQKEEVAELPLSKTNEAVVTETTAKVKEPVAKTEQKTQVTETSKTVLPPPVKEKETAPVEEEKTLPPPAPEETAPPPPLLKTTQVQLPAEEKQAEIEPEKEKTEFPETQRIDQDDKITPPVQKTEIEITPPKHPIAEKEQPVKEQKQATEITELPPVAEKQTTKPKTEDKKHHTKPPVTTPETKPQQKEREQKGKKLIKQKEIAPEKELPEEVIDYQETNKIVLLGPKVIGKINLEEINSKTRPDKKPIKKDKKENNRPEKKSIESSAKPEESKPRVVHEKTESKESVEKRKRKRIVKKVGADWVQKVDAAGNKKEKERIESPERSKSKVLVKKSDLPETGEVSEKEIQEKIKSTMARLGGSAGGPSTKNVRAKLRKQKRETAAIKREAEEMTDSKTLQVTEFITANELAQLMNVPVTTIITTCFSLGLVVSINQRLDAEVIELLAEEFGYDVEFASITEQDEEEEAAEDLPADLESRPPIVTIMGHVDHGKTSLLDYIRTANVVAGEVGGITQHIGAYEVTTDDNKQITFLDTPGHEAFTAMRARGAKVTDIAVIVIAADDQVMPQTKEAISHAQAAGVPMIFAINKVDKPDANPDKIREQLAQMNLLVEEWGGKYQCQEISAKKGLNIDLLLEKILFEAEMLDLKANPHRNAVGTVIEASLDKGRGYVTTILVQNGTLHVGDMMLAGQYFGKVKAMFNERGSRVKEAPPSTPVIVLGLNGAPQAGDKIKVMDSEQDAKEIAYKRQQIYREQMQRTSKHITLEEIGRRLALGNFKELNLIVKGDVDGSVEALCDSLQRLSTEEIQIRIIHKGVGAITESDVLLASASDAIVIGFQVRPTANARRQADQENIDIRLYSIIYNAINEIRSAMEGMLEPTVEERFVCNVEVRDVFKITKVGTVAGCYVTEGKINRDTKVRIIRDGIVVHSGEISSLKRFKDDVKEVIPGMECGISIKNFNDIRLGDIIEGYEEVQIKRTL